MAAPEGRAASRQDEKPAFTSPERGDYNGL